MKKTALLILSILIGLNSYSQNELQSVKLSDEHSWRSNSQSELNEFYFKVEPIENSMYKYHFRHQRDGQIVNIYSKNGEVFLGELINSITQYKDTKTDFGKDLKANCYIYERIKLNTDSATKVGKMILNQKFYSTPTDTLIEGWNFGRLHCGGINFSYKTQNYFQFSEYTCHWHQNDSINYVTAIKTMYDTIGQILDLQTKYSEFESKLEKGKTYSKNGFVMIYIMSKKQSLAFEKSKPKRDYLKSIKDTIDNYLNFKLDSLETTFDTADFSCYSYNLTFGKNGKLKKIWTHPIDKMKLRDGLSWYIEDKIERGKCKRLVKKIFKKVNLSSFELEYNVYRTFYIDFSNVWRIIDNTIY